MAAAMLARSRVGSSLSMVGAAAGAVAAPSVWASDGVQKSASFFTMILVGFILRLKITNPQFTQGIQALIMNCLLPCVTFKVRIRDQCARTADGKVCWYFGARRGWSASR